MGPKLAWKAFSQLKGAIAGHGPQYVEAVRMVREMLKDAPEGMSSQELWRMSEVKYPSRQFPVPVEPPTRYGKKGVPLESVPGPTRPGHAIHSMKFLKSIVLDSLRRGDVVKKIHIQRPPASDSELQSLKKKNTKVSKRLTRKKDEGVVDPDKQPVQFGVIEEWRWVLSDKAQDKPVTELPEFAKSTLQSAPFAAPTTMGAFERSRIYPPQGLWDHLNSRRRQARESEPTAEEILDIEVEKKRRASERGMKNVNAGRGLYKMRDSDTPRRTESRTSSPGYERGRTGSSSDRGRTPTGPGFERRSTSPGLERGRIPAGHERGRVNRANVGRAYI